MLGLAYGPLHYTARDSLIAAERASVVFPRKQQACPQTVQVNLSLY